MIAGIAGVVAVASTAGMLMVQLVFNASSILSFISFNTSVRSIVNLTTK